MATRARFFLHGWLSVNAMGTSAKHLEFHRNGGLSVVDGVKMADDCHLSVGMSYDDVPFMPKPFCGDSTNEE